jgi:multiple antibiotic resistance protein
MPFELSYVFTIVFATLGPLKAIPHFALLSADLDAAGTRKLAIQGALIASLIVAGTALFFAGTLETWHISLPALQIAGGILLFLTASKGVLAELGAIRGASAPAERPAPKPYDDSVKVRALTPLAVPTIVSPIGLFVILLFTGMAKGNASSQAGVYGILAAMMAMNLVGMLLAKRIVGFAGLPLFLVLGWIMSVLQAGLAVQAIWGALQTLGMGV